MRNNGGGFFPAGVDVAKMLLSGGDIVLIADSQGVRDSYEADGTAVDSKSQLAVLVNRGTASASEVRLGTRSLHPYHLISLPLTCQQYPLLRSPIQVINGLDFLLLTVAALCGTKHKVSATCCKHEN